MNSYRKLSIKCAPGGFQGYIVLTHFPTALESARPAPLHPAPPFPKKSAAEAPPKRVPAQEVRAIGGAKCYLTQEAQNAAVTASHNILEEMSWRWIHSTQTKKFITPIHKGDSRALTANYRPIALTSHIIKIFEKLLRKNISTTTNMVFAASDHASVSFLTTSIRSLISWLMLMSSILILQKHSTSWTST